MDEDYKKLYDVVSAKFNIGDYDRFVSKMQTPEDRKKFYDTVSAKGLSLGDYDKYEERLKKKEPTTTDSTSPLEDTDAVTGDTARDGVSVSVDSTDAPKVDQTAVTQFSLPENQQPNLQDFDPSRMDKAFGAEARARAAENLEKLSLAQDVAETSPEVISGNLKAAKDNRAKIETESVIPLQMKLEEKKAALTKAEEVIRQQQTQESVDQYEALREDYNSTVEQYNLAGQEYKSALDAEATMEKLRVIKESQRGTFGGAFRNSVVAGEGSIVKGVTRFATEVMAAVLPDKMISPELESGEKTRTQVLDEFEFDFIQQVGNDLLTSWGTENTSKEYVEAQQEGFWGGAILGLARSTPAMVGGLPTLIGQAYNDGYETIDEVAGDKMSRYEKQLYGASFGIAQGALEKAGLQTIMNKGLIARVTNEAIDGLLSSGKKITAANLSIATDEVAKTFIRGTTGEFLTGTGQEIGSITIEKITNALKDEEIFDKQSFTEYFERVMVAGAQEAVGGFIMSSIPAVGGNIKKAKPQEYDIADKTVKMAGEVAEYIETKRKAEEITQEQADQLLKDTQEFVEINQKIPEDLPPETKLKAHELLQEKARLEKEIEGKDPALVKAKTERIKGRKNEDGTITDGIDQELEKLVTQKQQTDGVQTEATQAETQEVSRTISESTQGGVYYMDGEVGAIREDGQTVVFETKDRIIELGNKEEIAANPISEFGIEQEAPLNIQVQSDNSVTIDGETYVNNFSKPQAAINTDADGNVVSVNLETESGQKRTIRGQRAGEITYQYKLKEFEQNATEQSVERLEQEVTRLEAEAAKPQPETKKRSIAPRKPKAVKPKTETDGKEKRPVLGKLPTEGGKEKGRQDSAPLRTEKKGEVVKKPRTGEATDLFDIPKSLSVVEVIDYDAPEKNKYPPNNQLNFNQGEYYGAVTVIVNDAVKMAISIGAKIINKKFKDVPDYDLKQATDVAKKLGYVTDNGEGSTVLLNKAVKELAKQNRNKNTDVILVLGDIKTEKPAAETTTTKPKQDAVQTKKTETKAEEVKPEKDFESSLTKGLKSAESFLADLEAKLDQFGKETLGTNLPVAVAKTAIQAARVAASVGKTASQAIDAAISEVKKSQWYKDLSERNKAKAEANVEALISRGEMNIERETIPSEPPKGQKKRRFAARSQQYARKKGEAIRESPEDYYTPQVQEEIQGRLDKMTNEQLVEKMTIDGLFSLVDGPDNLSVMAGVELLRRKIERGEDAGMLMVNLSKLGTSLGQLVAQYATLKTSTPEGLSMLVTSAMNKAGRQFAETKKQPESKAKVSKKERGKQIADKIRKVKFSNSIRDMSKLRSSAIAPIEIAWDGSVEAFALAVETTGNVAEAIDKAIEYLRETDWYKSLSDKSKDVAEDTLRADLTEQSTQTETEREIARIEKKLLPGSNQAIKLQDIAKRLIEAQREFTKLSEAFVNGEQISEKDVQKQVKNIENAARDLEVFASAVIPKGWADLLVGGVQGNLLTLMSVAKNPVYNVGAMVSNVPANIIGEAGRRGARGVGKAVSFVLGKEFSDANNVPIFTLGSFVFASKMMFSRGFRDTYKTSIKGIKAGDVTYEYRMGRGFMPFRAAVLAISDTKLGDALGVKRGQLSVTADGKISLNDRFKKLFEASPFMMNAELMFRALPWGDVPFSTFEKYRQMHMYLRSQGLRGRALESALKYPSLKTREFAQERAAKAVFQEDSATAKLATEVIGKLSRIMESSGIPIVDNFGRFIVRSQFPYIKTPVNVINQTADFAIWPLSAIKAVYSFSKGDYRTGSEYMGKAVVGYMMLRGAVWLIANGLVTGAMYGGDEEGTERKERSLGYAKGFGPSRINVTGIQRAMNDEDPKYREGDVTVDYRSLGFFAAILGMHANSEASLRRIRAKENNKKIIGMKPTRDFSYVIDTFGNIPEFTRYAVDQTFLTGTSALMNALTGDERDYRNWATQTFRSVSTVALPNNLSMINRMRVEYMPDLRDDDWMTQMKNIVLERTFQTDGLPVKYDLFGEPILQNPENKNAFLNQAVDFLNIRSENPDPLIMEISDIYELTQDPRVIPNAPKRKFTYDGAYYEMSLQQYQEYFPFIQRLKAEMMRKEISKENWSKKKPSVKVDYLHNAHTSAESSAKAMKFKKEMSRDMEALDYYEPYEDE